MTEVDFKTVLKDAGIPTTQPELMAQWKADLLASGSAINNDNAYSPFWRTISALITRPMLWIIDLLANTALPSFFVKYAEGVFLDLLADAVNLTRKEAVATVANITFTRADIGQQVTVPVDTVIQTASLNARVYQLKTSLEGRFLEGSPTLEIPAVAVESGAAFNLPTGYYAILPVAIANVTSVSNQADWLVTPGADQETDDELRQRIKNQFGTASNFHTDSVYRSLIATFPGVAVDSIWFVHNAPRGPGTADAYVLFDFTAPVAQYLSDINRFIMDHGNHGHGDDLLVVQMPEKNRVLKTTVWYDQGLTPTEIVALKSHVTDFINAAFRENSLYNPTLTRPFSRFSFSRLGQELHREFSGIHSVDFDSDDIVSELWIPRLSSLTVTLQVTE